MIRIHTSRRILEICAWVIYFYVDALVNATTVLFDYARRGLALAPWEPFVWEISSATLTLLLIPLVLRLDQFFPLAKSTWGRSLAVHALATVPFSILHVTGMVIIRKTFYLLVGRVYEFGNIFIEFFYEWRKDCLTYGFILAVLYGYRLYREKAEGAARFANHPKGDTDVSPAEPVRFTVSHGNRKFGVNAEEIDWIEAAGNYVILHVDGRNYALRNTMKEVESKLMDAGLIRVHRSAIVNAGRVKELKPTPSGDYELILTCGDVVRMSRRYRAQNGGFFPP
ncbi:MAG: LytTR family DNA-binding domain-containing protein [Pseudomonadota bacterium]